MQDGEQGCPRTRSFSSRWEEKIGQHRKSGDKDVREAILPEMDGACTVANSLLQVRHGGRVEEGSRVQLMVRGEAVNAPNCNDVNDASDDRAIGFIRMRFCAG